MSYLQPLSKAEECFFKNIGPIYKSKINSVIEKTAAKCKRSVKIGISYDNLEERCSKHDELCGEDVEQWRLLWHWVLYEYDVAGFGTANRGNSYNKPYHHIILSWRSERDEPSEYYKKIRSIYKQSVRERDVFAV